MKWIFAIALLLSACAPKAIVVEPIAPAAASLRAKTEASATAAKRVSTGAQEISKKSSDLQAEIIKGMLEAERIRKAGLATPEQLDANADAWKAVHARNLFLEAAAKTVTIDASELEATTRRTSEDAAALEKTAIAHDKSVETLKSDMAKQSGDAAVGKAIRNLVWIAIIGSLALAVLWIVLKFIKPL